ncbi:uncharacterized protein [Epargyreus clarus]|uniref:uncharacterized protein n=1 Tax=Epargyreus clarus TaxID=520877 RepID=UPI003C2FD506
MECNYVLSLLVVLVLSWEAHAAVNCSETGAGRFADPDDTTCKNYTLCSYSSSTGTYSSYDYVCPSTSLFNPSTSACTVSSDFVCNVTSTTNTSCTADGFFVDPSSTNCSSYIECIEIDGTFLETSYTCPDDTNFNPNTTLCDSDYTCTSTFSCTAAGRFASTSDTTCQTYYFCVLIADGTYLQYNYTCPTSSVFSPTARLCTTSYTCTTS